MKSVARETHRDDEAMFTGTHSGASASATLRDDGKNFRALGVDPALSQYAENETQGTSGAVTAADENTVTVSGVTWDDGDTYGIYKTSTKDSTISTTWTDVSKGWKIKDTSEVNEDGWFPEDADLDDHGRKKVFGPGQPKRN